jgi:DNA-binding transcriptional MocR family regulator
LADPIRESGRHLAVLLELDGEGPLYRQIADGLKRAVDRGEIPLGTVLPPERSLAGELAVSRATVVAAYERLKAEGWLESRQGSGTWVRQPDPDPVDEDATYASRVFVPSEAEVSGSRPAAAGDETVDLAAAVVTGTPTVADVLGSLTAEEMTKLTRHHGYVPGGLRELREHVARRFTAQGVTTTDDQILVTTGAQQAISLVARLHLRPGDTVLAESPTFAGALDACRAAGARLVPLPIDGDGVRTELLEELVERHDPRLVYLTPTFHNGTGAVLPLERRQQLVELAARTRLTVLEDGTLADLDLDRRGTPPPLSALHDEAAIHTIGSTAKLFWAGLRVGWVRLPPGDVPRALASKTALDLGTGLVGQVLALRLLEHADEVLAERRAELVPRRDHLCRLLANRLPTWSWRRPTGGLALWVELPSGNADEFAEVAARHGVAIVPGTALTVDAGSRRAVRLTFARPHDVLAEGVERLAAAWEAYGPTDTRPASRLLV